MNNGSNKVSEMITSSMERIQNMVNVNTVVGAPITTPDGTTIIPISKVKIGMGGGGSDFSSAKKADKDNPFGLGGTGIGCGLNIDPVAFLIVNDGHVRMLPIAEPASTTLDRLVENGPDLLDKLADFLDSRKKSKEDPSGADA